MKLFDLYADLSLNASEFNNGIKQAASVGESFQGNVTAISAKAVALGHALYDVGKQAVQIAANLAKSVVSEYADTEQLLGGVDGQDPPTIHEVLNPEAATQIHEDEKRRVLQAVEDMFNMFGKKDVDDEQQA